MKFRRKAEPTQAPDGPDRPVAPTLRRPPRRPAPVPFDESEVAGDGVERVDLGSLLVASHARVASCGSRSTSRPAPCRP